VWQDSFSVFSVELSFVILAGKPTCSEEENEGTNIAEAYITDEAKVAKEATEVVR